MVEDFDVGVRLREVRVEAGLSQRALAERAGVPHGQISLVETNRNSPSVASLRKILGGIPITMSDFFEPDRTENDSVFFGHEDLIELTARMSKDSAPISIKQAGDARLHNLQILYERYSPGSDTGASMLEHAGHEGGVVIAGRLEVTVGSQRKVLGPGDTYLFESRIPHRFRNTGKEEVILISAGTPPYL
ncbi:cupin domain-containing protein [Sphingobium sp. H33]|uniref:Cupin domain-containing protein n=2 Tax=Sphingobium nicotianae TaxID=2782607 RepID=A0A9X1IPD2_9SPHN|nr:cupin domain-containing protein [Sphingobium nicotianae]MBT2186027.1 cupin domain-containing protein [Sphingobium nicotianae]